MTRDLVTAKLTEAQAEQQRLLQQRARLVELLESTTAQVQAAQGRIGVLQELLALDVPAQEGA